jgi:hypothetical protein
LHAQRVVDRQESERLRPKPEHVARTGIDGVNFGRGVHRERRTRRDAERANIPSRAHIACDSESEQRRHGAA